MRPISLLLVLLAGLVISGRAMAQSVRARFATTAGAMMIGYVSDDGDDEGDDDGDYEGDDDQDAGENDSINLDGIIMYGIDDNSHSLIRYDLTSDLHESVGLIHLDGGTTIAEIQSLGYIPGQLNLYGVWNYLGSTGSKLVKIDMFSGKATPLAEDTGYGDVEGLVSVFVKGESDDESDDEDDDVAVAGSININPNNSPQNEFELQLSDGSVISRDDLEKDYSGYSGAAVSIHVKPKGNGNQNGLVVDGDAYSLDNGKAYDIAASEMSVNLYNDHIVHGEAKGHWWIDVDAEDASINSGGDDDDHYGDDDDHGDDDEHGDDGEDHEHHDGGNWWLYGVSNVSDGSSLLVKIDPDTGVGEAVMPLSRTYKGLAYSSNDDDGIFYAVSDNALWKIDPESGVETAVGQDDYFDIHALEFVLGSKVEDDHGDDGDDDEHEGEGSSGHGILFGFSDIDNTLLIMNPDDGSGSAVNASINKMDLEGIVFLEGSVDPKESLAKVAFD